MGNRRQVFLYIGTEKQPLCAYGSTEGVTVYLLNRDGCWQQLHIQCGLISAPQ